MHAPKLTISKFAHAAGVGVETVRYYQRRGLLPIPKPRSNTYREYDEALLRQLRFIRRLQAAGFTLKDIQDLIRLDRTKDRPHIQQIAAKKLQDLNAQMRELKRVANGLKTVLHECEHARSGLPCPIMEAFDD